MSEQKSFLCEADNSCLLLIDIQGKLSAAIPDKVINRLRSNVETLLAAANKLNVPVMATAQYPRGLGPIEDFITARLNDQALTYDKTCFSCMGAQGLADDLASSGRKQVIVTGIEAHICVLQTAFELKKAGLEVFVVNDAIASRKLSSYDTALGRMTQGDINIVTTESVLFEWLRDASHVHFRELSKLIV
ncbi:MAG: isochorismatase family protein [Gammaproteobacteria bacterium]